MYELILIFTTKHTKLVYIYILLITGKKILVIKSQ